jgi:putative RecB family exonuclease
VEHLPEPPTAAALKGTLVHRALELLFTNHPRGLRSRSAARASLDTAWRELREGDELGELGLDQVATAAFIADSGELVNRYFELEDPNAVRAVGLELNLSTTLEGVTVRGIIDRLDELDDGSLVVVDYKTGRAPSVEQSKSRLGGVQMYALMCEAELGRRPAVVRLIYLRDRVVISAVPTDQAMRGTRQRALGVWSAIERACRQDDFRPNPSGLCRFCSFQAYCPAFGGDPARAASELSVPGRVTAPSNKAGVASGPSREVALPASKISSGPESLTA